MEYGICCQYLLYVLIYSISKAGHVYIHKKCYSITDKALKNMNSYHCKMAPTDQKKKERENINIQ